MTARDRRHRAQRSDDALIARPRAVAAMVLAIALLSGGVASSRGAAVGAKMPATPATNGALAGERWNRRQRDADRTIERQIRRAIRADPFLLRAAPAVKVTSRGGVVRLVGHVRTSKEWSSIAFKAGQGARAGSIDDRVSIGDGVEAGL